MDTITVIIRMTGLLLFARPSNAPTSPTYVLMPAAPGHVAQFGYRTSDPAGCAYWEHNVCYLNLSHEEIELGRIGHGSAARLPPGNISAASNRAIAPAVFGAQPGTRLAARLKLNEGRLAATCSLGRFAFGRATENLASVVDWEFPFVGEGPFVITRRSLIGAGLRTDTLHRTLGVIELFVRNIPSSEQSHDSRGSSLSIHQKVNHFAYFYSLLEPAGLGPLPTLAGINRVRGCTWIGRPRLGQPTEAPVHTNIANAGTLSCMVISGNPGGPWTQR